MDKIATGVPSLDMVLEGGLPKGSVILLLGEVGSGHYEFAYTSTIASSDDAKKVCYLSMTRSTDHILDEMRSSFSNLPPGDNLKFMDFSESYFKNSHIPLSWSLNPKDDECRTLSLLKGMGQEQGILKSMVDRLDEHAPDSLVIIDSLTMLTRTYSGEESWNEFIKYLQGIQRVSKRWNGLIYLILTANIFGKAIEEEIADIADGVFIFKWEEAGTGGRRRSMFIKKLRGEVSKLEEGNIAKFDVNLSSFDGLSFAPIHHIMGRI